MTENGRNNIFRDKEKIKMIPVMFSDVNVVTEI